MRKRGECVVIKQLENTDQKTTVNKPESVVLPVEINTDNINVVNTETNINLPENGWFNINKHDIEVDGKYSKILVVLPAWRDTDVINTIYDLYITAANPKRVYVIAVIQLENNPFDYSWWTSSISSMYAALASYNIPTNNISTYYMSSDHIRGAGTARRLGWQFAGVMDCDFVMSIDSHSRFALGWDRYNIAACQELEYRGYEKPCLTNLPWGFEIPDDLNEWAKNGPLTSVWDSPLPFVSNRVSKVQEQWRNVGMSINSEFAIKSNPIELWTTLTEYQKGTSVGNSPTRSSTSIELKILGYSVFGLPWYQGQFIADYETRKSKVTPKTKNIIDLAVPAYKIAGGFVFLRSSCARLIEFSNFLRVDDELIPSMRLFRSGVELFTPNLNTVYHWYERPGLPRPGWTHDIYMRGYDCIHNEINLIGFNYDWRSDLKYGNTKNVSGFFEEPEDIVLSSMDGVRCFPKSKDFYYNRVGLHTRELLIDLELLECSGKRMVPDLDYVNEKNQVRPFYLDINFLNCNKDVSALESSLIVIEMLDGSGNVVGSKSLTLLKTGASQNTAEIKGQMAIRILTSIFCYPDRSIPRQYRALHEGVEIARSDLYTPRVQKYLASM